MRTLTVVLVAYLALVAGLLVHAVHHSEPVTPTWHDWYAPSH